MGAFYCPSPVSAIERNVDLPPGALLDTRRALLVYDIRSPLAPGTATLLVNGVAAGTLPGHDTTPGAAGSEWSHRSLDVDPALLHAGSNVVRVEMEGDVELDRLQLELHLDGLHADGFEGDGLAQWDAAAPVGP
jgi:hypothetical protein